MITRDKLAIYLRDYLACDNFNDYAPNGLQIEGKETIGLICTAVTASEEIIHKALALQADALLVHHGYFWQGEAQIITGMKKRRIGQLLKGEINLFAYHLPLDCHPDVGNNACIAELLGIEAVEKHCAGKVPNLLWSGRFPQPISAYELSRNITEKLKREPLAITVSDKPIERLAWCTGAAQNLIEDAYHLGVDAYLSGEISERTYYQAQELGIHYFACGHHSSERYGIQALGQHLSTKFGLRHQFIDSANPV
ncbi:Nif3-like dinuclear metal center hexameric protein [Legionella oakridgensis]|uniref:Dinuclear metal center protein, YbgI/SA1388 family n=2 Tax=Legionella oakridgensis TaxID=29423 RepID=W0BC75_9GAMM|nr:Nif3-like dinuclear metal center hexameric protein [Legionella oakridgensis]AHE67455.1 dinuclear metal center protein, YbgI/SA1388 family [Legionella oakridgensis ATCC 33761 = DSM 21215]ETO92984.1 dinuclear metal center protein, YbgI/SA1388 family [Legionella oakridgensis RV-2-2007]KTD43512.1 putative NIF3-like protein 1 [Legionella oakridgensis]STY20504.1 putative NIF3-like protein 1 [Legionella longbeachae]